MSVTHAQRAENRIKIVSGALDLMAEKPLASVTVDELARRSGVSFWSAYRNQPSREQIFRMATTHLGKQITSAVVTAAVPTGSVRAAVHAYAQRVAAVMQGEDYFRLLSIAIREGRDNAWLKDAYEDVAGPIAAGLEEAVRVAGEQYGTLMLMQPGTARRFVQRLEWALVMPRLHPASDTPQADEIARTIEVVTQEVVAATYACEWQTASAA